MKTPLVKIILIVVCLCALAVPVLAGNNIEVTASVDKQTAYIGDLIQYTVTVTYDSTIQLTPPAVGLNLGQFDVKDYKVRDREVLKDGRYRQSLWFSMRTFTTGDYIIPPLPIEYMLPDSTKKVISSDPIKIHIKSILAEGASADTLKLRDLKKQVSLESGLPTWIIIALVGGGILIIGLGMWWWLKKRPKEKEEYVDPRPAWEIAFADLAMLKDKNLLAQGELKPYYFELTEIIRRYVGKQFNFDAVDLTTGELDEYFRQTTMDKEFRERLIGFLEHADLIKFAKYIPPAEKPDEDWQEAYELIEASREMHIENLFQERTDTYVPTTGSADDVDDEWKYAPPGYRELMTAKPTAPPKEDDSDEEAEV